MWSTIFNAASTVMSNRQSSQPKSAATTMAEAKAAYNFKPYMEELKTPTQAVKVGAITQGSSYTELLNAWDNFLNNDYLEISKSMKG